MDGDEETAAWPYGATDGLYLEVPDKKELDCGRLLISDFTCKFSSEAR
jgi:hypothetical protein